MDLDSESVSQDMSRSTIPGRMNGILAVDDSGLRAACALCQRILSSDNEAGDLEAIGICGDCKILFLDNIGTPVRDSYRRALRVRRRRRRYSSSESIENLFSQQFSHMINLARQNQPTVFDHENHTVDDGARLVQRTSSRNTPSGSRRWRRVLSDTESDGFDSYYAESESNISDTISFSAYGVDSDASVDGHSFLDNDTDIDTDIDPMHAGPNQWNSDDQEEEDDEEEEEENNDWDEADPYVGNSGDYLHPRGLEELLEHLAMTDVSRQGAPPAALSFINSLKHLLINEEHAKQNGLGCAICKDSLSIGTVVHQLPCFHFYHPSCILPWLSTRNSCPLCRYELPTDDKDYENGRQRSRRGLEIHEIQHQGVDEDDSSSDITDGAEADVDHATESSGEESESGRWLLLAAPIVSLVGIVLVLWLGKPLTERRGLFARRDFPVQGQHSNRRSENNRSRRWWSLF